jgi:hypothetical protein
MNHLMIDLETMGNKSNAAIVAIGAVEFEITSGKMGKEFYTRVDLQSSIDHGLVMDASTVMWWLGQSEEARKEICKTGENIKHALGQLNVFIGNKYYHVWSNSARFDLSILATAYAKINPSFFTMRFRDLPWDFRKERCVRTYLALDPSARDFSKFNGTAHNAVDDCKFQIDYCSNIHQRINLSK